jgi:para-nitrobenzyl esterase
VAPLIKFSIINEVEGLLFPSRAGVSKEQRKLVSRAAVAAVAMAVLPAVVPVHAQGTSAQPIASSIVQTSAGLVIGLMRSSGGAEFLGIPYAEPPVGKLRWQPPVPKKPWKGTRDALSFGASCAQPLLGGAWNQWDADHGQEDCLYLNVITPVWPAAGKLPVMFWIHGGANAGGSGSGALYNDGTLTGHGVLLVTINYRLSVFGFLAHPALAHESRHQATGNYGLMDQIRALEWVKKNIANFGGDPNNITVFGQSAGSIDTGILMTSPLALGLFQKAIAESGSPFAPVLIPLADAEKQGEDIVKDLNLPEGAKGIEALRKIPANDLLAKLGPRAQAWPGIGPDIDGWVVPRRPEAVFAARQEAAIPLLLGTTSREFGNFEPLDALRLAINNAMGDLAPQALALYGLAGDGQGTADPLYGTAAIQWNADIVFHCPITTEALWHSARNPTYEYELDHATPGKEAVGALHSADLPYVFGSFPKTGDIGGTFGPIDFQLAELMESYWTNFAKTGNPNADHLPHWPAVDANQQFLRFTQDGNALVSTTPLRAPQCALYRKALEEKIKAAR